MKSIKLKVVIAMLIIIGLHIVLSKGQFSTVAGERSIDKTDTTKLINFIFKDSLNRDVRISDFAGKMIVVDIWYSGCGACMDCNHALRMVHDRLKNENIIFLSISIDKLREKWLLSITKDATPTNFNPWAGKYCPAPGTITLYTGGSGSSNEFIKKYVPKNAYPQLLIVDKKGNIISRNPPRPDHNPEIFVEYLKHYL